MGNLTKNIEKTKDTLKYITKIISMKFSSTHTHKQSTVIVNLLQPSGQKLKNSEVGHNLWIISFL